MTDRSWVPLVALLLALVGISRDTTLRAQSFGGEVLAVGLPILAGQRTAINSGSSNEIASIPGLSAKKALAIVDYRKRWGDFCTLDALVGVPGIGPATVEKIRPYSRVRQPDVNAAIREWDADRFVLQQGIGPVLSGRILREGSRIGGYRCLDQLEGVEGISARMASRLWDVSARDLPEGSKASVVDSRGFPE